MKLYHAAASPFVRKVMIVLHETDQLADVTIVPASGTAVDPGTIPLSLNPLGKIPALERADGPALYDSRVICRYLDERAKGGLYPDGSGKWDTLTLEATGDGIMEASILTVYEARIRPEELHYKPWLDGQQAKRDRALDALESRWMGHLAGALNIGHVAIGAALGYLDFRNVGPDWRTGRPALTDWFAAISERPSFVATKP